jgi:hypothetical protein
MDVITPGLSPQEAGYEALVRFLGEKAAAALRGGSLQGARGAVPPVVGVADRGAERGPARPGLSTGHICPGASGCGPGRPGGARLEWARGGSVGRIVMPKRKGEPREVSSRRGCVVQFSRKSRRRLLVVVNSIDREQVPPEAVWFVTLTLPGEFNPDPEVHTRWLTTFRKRFERKFGKWGMVWKREYQKRGAPHWHFLALVPEEYRDQLRQVREWVAVAWYQIVASGDVRHLRAGTAVEAVRSWRGVVSYAAKYLGKETALPVDPDTGEFVPAGKFWGIWNRSLLPIEWEQEALPVLAACRVRRVLWDYLDRKRGMKLGSAWRSGSAGVLAFLASGTWLKLATWAAGVT